MTRRRLLWSGSAILIAAAAAAGWIGVTRSRERDPFAFETVKVDRGRVIAKVTATGTLSAIVTVQVGSQVSGTIAALHADFNSTVKKGELVAKIDSRLFDAAVEQARANLAAADGNYSKAKAQAVDAERQADRAAALLARKLIAQADSDTARATADADAAAVDAAAGTVSQAKAQLHQAEVNLAYTDIRSPTDGTVIARNVDVGQTVAASLAAPTLFLIAEDLRKMQVDTSVAEADIGKLQADMKATFTVDAYPNESFSGRVRQIRNSPQTVQNVVTYDAVIDVENAELKLKPGMTANCTFIYADKENVLRVPNAAMRFMPPPELLATLNAGAPSGEAAARHARWSAGGGAGAGAGAGDRGGVSGNGGPGAEGGPTRGGRGGSHGDPTHKTVWVLRDGAPMRVPIKTGVTDGSTTEIVEGDLQEGDALITDLAGGAAAKAAPGQAAGNFPRRLF
ncbi:MAG TPA: efflux RND transporter periplasmic adaptor subunit [Patescibacteria group bacterium]|nr:efflux RND transporter periplasmic adaptor subunit [Patescibacteria group bacterium]